MCAVLLPPGGNPIAVKYIISYVLMSTPIVVEQTLLWIYKNKNVAAYCSHNAQYVLLHDQSISVSFTFDIGRRNV
jgi:hypothetical protein